jgi:hypothetical protein
VGLKDLSRAHNRCYSELDETTLPSWTVVVHIENVLGLLRRADLLIAPTWAKRLVDAAEP